MKYDIFISYSRRDYVDENENIIPGSPVKAVLDFLSENKISYWFDKDGVYSGSRFVEVISNAIADSKIMVFISSVHSNESIYTAGEIFEALENKLLLIPIKIDDSKYNKAFKLLLNPLDYIDFAKKDALCELLTAIKTEIDRLDKLEADKIRLQEEEECKKKEEYEKLKFAERLKKEQEERLAKRNEILTDVRDLIVQIENHRLAQKNIIERVYSNLQCIDISHKSCPVCQTHCKLDSEYCPICGWHFATFSAIQELEIEQDESERNALTHYSATWENSKSASPYVSCEIKRLKEENKQKRYGFNDILFHCVTSLNFIAHGVALIDGIGNNSSAVGVTDIIDFGYFVPERIIERGIGSVADCKNNRISPDRICFTVF